MSQRDSELAIDLIRGLAALLVLLSHVITPVLQSAFGHDPQSWPTGWHVVGSTLGAGVFWVWLFFVISGFCIHQSIARSMENGSFRPSHYAFARITRIYPIFLVGLLLAVGGWWFTKGYNEPGPFPTKSLLASLVMLQDFTGVFPGYAPSWSLTNEMIYYAAWPLALILCRRDNSKAMVTSTIITLLITAITVAIWKTQFAGDPNHWLIPVWVISGLYAVWLSGAWLAVVWAKLQAWTTPSRWVIGVTWMLVLYAAEAILTYHSARAWTHMLAAYLAVPGFTLLIGGGHYLHLSASAQWSGIARWMGTLSYPCYLLHQPIIHIIEHSLSHERLHFDPVTHFLILLIPSLLLVFTLGVYLERIFMTYRSSFLRSSHHTVDTISSHVLGTPQ